MHIFRAWIDERGSNKDWAHEEYCSPALRNCQHIRLRDLETGSYRIVTRLLTRRCPFLFQVAWFWNGCGRTVIRIGKGPW